MSSPTKKQLLLVNLALISSTVTLTVLGEKILHIHHLYLIFLLCGLIYLAAASRTPSILYQTVRSTSWFSLIKDDGVMVTLLVFLGILFFLIGLLGFVMPTHLPIVPQPAATAMIL